MKLCRVRFCDSNRHWAAGYKRGEFMDERTRYLWVDAWRWRFCLIWHRT